jgi:hypothetical protein
MTDSPRFPCLAGPLDPPDHLNLLFRQRGKEGHRYLVDGIGFVADTAKEASPIHFRSGDRSVILSRFNANLSGVQAVVPFQLREEREDSVLAEWAGYEWQLPRSGGKIDFTGYQSLLRDIRVTGGPYAAIRVLWRDTGELLQYIGFTAEMLPPRPTSLTQPARSTHFPEFPDPTLRLLLEPSVKSKS